mmetsp:Transcript_11209/g.17331  ORF Transcript_11209/g.17331 Transcript_11209/m.17331 type:complete len:92 (+) Transcript_11209:309-584(+)
MEECVFHTTHDRGPDQFPTVISELALYLGANIPGGGYLIKALDPNELSMPVITRPSPPTEPLDPLQMQDYKDDMWDWQDETKNQRKANDMA